ncbi:MAG: hypothetical protein H6711_25495 [Myxococcales bacterium]|nr:hypothetical protein [Myxococcales bacterium]
MSATTWPSLRLSRRGGGPRLEEDREVRGAELEALEDLGDAAGGLPPLGHATSEEPAEVPGRGLGEVVDPLKIAVAGRAPGEPPEDPREVDRPLGGLLEGEDLAHRDRHPIAGADRRHLDLRELARRRQERAEAPALPRRDPEDQAQAIAVPAAGEELAQGRQPGPLRGIRRGAEGRADAEPDEAEDVPLDAVDRQHQPAVDEGRRLIAAIDGAHEASELRRALPSPHAARDRLQERAPAAPDLADEDRPGAAGERRLEGRDPAVAIVVGRPQPGADPIVGDALALGRGPDRPAQRLAGLAGDAHPVAVEAHVADHRRPHGLRERLDRRQRLS